MCTVHTYSMRYVYSPSLVGQSTINCQYHFYLLFVLNTESNCCGLFKAEHPLSLSVFEEQLFIAWNSFCLVLHFSFHIAACLSEIHFLPFFIYALWTMKTAITKERTLYELCVFSFVLIQQNQLVHFMHYSFQELWFRGGRGRGKKHWGHGM